MSMKTLAIFPLLVLALSGCETIAETGGRLADGSLFAEKTIARYEGGNRGSSPFGKVSLRETRGRNGEASLVFTMEKYPAIALRGVPSGDGVFYFTALEYLGGSYSGWNEFTLDLSGAGHFKKDGKSAFFSLAGPLEPVQISQGRIRRSENRLSGKEALTGLNNRQDRIAAVTSWMRVYAEESGRPSSFRDTGAFERLWKPILLPELVPAKRRPAAWNAAGTRVRSEDVRWNTSYTALLFPEDLRVLRDSGALLRDWEEALEWIRFEYEWDDMVRRLEEGIALKKI